MATLEFEKIDTEQLDFLYELTESEKCKVDRTEWRSKYNTYVVYDYEPFCTDGFEVYITLRGKPKNLAFIKHILDTRIKNIKFLEHCLKLRSK